MPRVVRDSDEDVETKSSIRRTRASITTNATDSPLRRSTRSNKQLITIESSPESLDDSNAQPTGRTTRSRTATMDKGTTLGKNLRSRKNSASSDVSESLEVESENTQKRVTRKNTQSTTGTPSKTSLRSRNVRAGSEAKSTPPVKSKRVTRASSVDPVGNLNESVGTPIKRRTRASIAPVEPTVTEEQESNDKVHRSLESTVIEIGEDDSENVTTSFSKEEFNRNTTSTVKEVGKDINNVKESFNDSEKPTLDSTKKFEESMTDKSYISNEESTIKSFVTHSIDSTLESSVSEIKINLKENKDINLETVALAKSQNIANPNELENNKHENILNIKSNLNDDENEEIDVESFIESTLTDHSIKNVNNPINDASNDFVDYLKIDIKDSYVKLDRTTVIEKILTKRADESKEIDIEENDLSSNDNFNKNSMLVDGKTAIVLINDIKNNENFVKKNSNCNLDNISKSIEIERNNENVKFENENENSKIISLSDDEKLSSISIDDDEEIELLISGNDDDNEINDNIYSANQQNSENENSISSNKNNKKIEIHTLPEELDSKATTLVSINENNNCADEEINDKDSMMTLDDDYIKITKCSKNINNDSSIKDNSTEEIYQNKFTSNNESEIVDLNKTKNTIIINPLNNENKTLISTLNNNKTENFENTNMINVKQNNLSSIDENNELNAAIIVAKNDNKETCEITKINHSLNNETKTFNDKNKNLNKFRSGIPMNKNEHENYEIIEINNSINDETTNLISVNNTDKSETTIIINKNFSENESSEIEKINNLNNENEHCEIIEINNSVNDETTNLISVNNTDKSETIIIIDENFSENKSSEIEKINNLNNENEHCEIIEINNSVNDETTNLISVNNTDKSETIIIIDENVSENKSSEINKTSNLMNYEKPNLINDKNNVSNDSQTAISVNEREKIKNCETIMINDSENYKTNNLICENNMDTSETEIIINENDSENESSESKKVNNSMNIEMINSNVNENISKLDCIITEDNNKEESYEIMEINDSVNNETKNLTFINKNVDNTETTIVINKYNNEEDNDQNKEIKLSLNDEMKNLPFINKNIDKSENIILINENNKELENNKIVKSLKNEVNISFCMNKNPISLETVDSIYKNDNVDSFMILNKYNDKMENITLINEKKEIKKLNVINDSCNLENSNKLSVLFNDKTKNESCKKMVDHNKLNDQDSISNDDKKIKDFETVNTLQNKTERLACVNFNNDNFEDLAIKLETSKSTDLDKDQIINFTGKSSSRSKDSISQSFNKEIELISSNNVESKDNFIAFNKNNEPVESVLINQSTNDLNINLNKYNDVENKSAINECNNEMGTIEKNAEQVTENHINDIESEVALEPVEIASKRSDRIDEIETTNIPDDFHTDFNQHEIKICEVDKNSVSSAVTDADGENASSLEKMEQTNASIEKAASPHVSPKEEKKKKKEKRDSESDGDAENLFQDIPAEDWFHNNSGNKSTAISQDLNVNKKDILYSFEESDADEESSEKTANSSKLFDNEVSHRRSNRMSLKQKTETSQELGLKDLDSKENSKNYQECNQSLMNNDGFVEEDSEKETTNKNCQSSKSKQSKDANELEKSNSLNDSTSSRKSRRSINKSLNQSTQEKENESENVSNTLINSKTLKRQSTVNILQNDKDFSVEAMDVDSENNDDNEQNEKLNDSKCSNKNRKSLNKSQLNELISKNESVSEKLSLNNSKMDKSLNKSSRKSLVGEPDEENASDDEAKTIQETKDNESESGKNGNKSISKKRESLGKSDENNKSHSMEEQNESFTKKLSTSLNESETHKNKMSPKNDVLSRKSFAKDSDEEIASIDKLNQSEGNENSFNKSKNKSIRLSNQNKVVAPKTEVEDVLEAKDKSLRKSLNKSASSSNEIDSKESENVNNSIKNKSLNSSRKSLKLERNTSTSSMKNKSIDYDNDDDDDDHKNNESLLNNSLEKSKNILNQSDLDKSFQKNIERMNFVNPPKHDFSTIAQKDSSSDNDGIPEFMFRTCDTDDDESSSDENEDDDRQRSIDSDIAKEYNLVGKNISKYSDDDVPGDECRASEEESSDIEDDGADLDDFIVSDQEVENEDEDETENDDEDDEDNEDENDEEDDEDGEDGEDDEEMDIKINDVKKNNADINLKKTKDGDNSKLSIKSKHTNISKSNYSQSSSSESNDEETATEVEGKNNFKKHKLSKDKNINLSKSTNDKGDSKSFKNKSFSISKTDSFEVSNGKTKSKKIDKNSKLKRMMNNETVSSSSESESEAGEDSYRVITTKELNQTALLSTKNTKLTSLMKCSTPKAGVIKAADFSKNTDSFAGKDNLSIATNKSTSSRRKSGSLNDLTDTKNVTSGLSVDDTQIQDISVNLKNDIDITNPSECALKNRQTWKLIPLNQTVNPAGNDTPVTKYLKKSKLNESFPILQSMKSNNLSNLKDGKREKSTSEKRKSQSNKDSDQEKEMINVEQDITQHPTVDKKMKKRKLQDMSNVTSIDDDSVLKEKKKKRARVEESIVQQVEDVENEKSNHQKENKKKKKKKNKSMETEEVSENIDDINFEFVEDEQPIKNNKKSNIKTVEVAQEEEEEKDKKLKKKKKNKSLKTEEEAQDIQENIIEVIKSKKKKSRHSDEKSDQENLNSLNVVSKKKRSQLSNEISDHECLDTEDVKPKKKKSQHSDEKLDQENINVKVIKSKKKSKLNMENDLQPSDKKIKKKLKEEKAKVTSDDEAPKSIGFEEAKLSALKEMQKVAESVKTLKEARKMKHKELVSKEKIAKDNESLKRLPDDVLDHLTDEPIRQPSKKPKLSKNFNENILIPSTSMFSPGKPVPTNLKVDDEYIPLSLAGGTTEFGVVNLQKAKKIMKKNPVVLNFREKMLARNMRQPSATYLMNLKKQKAKTEYMRT